MVPCILVYFGAGNVLLVINVERSPLSSSLRDILTYQFMTDDSGEWMISIAGQSVAYHKDFCLLLSSSVPLCVRGSYNSHVSNVNSVVVLM